MHNYRQKQIAKALRLLGFRFGKVGSHYDMWDAYHQLSWERMAGL